MRPAAQGAAIAELLTNVQVRWGLHYTARDLACLTLEGIGLYYVYPDGKVEMAERIEGGGTFGGAAADVAIGAGDEVAV
jgi:hypothetical protein